MARVPNLRSERGAVLIQTAVASFVLVGFGAFVIDYGVMWTGRHQAQNAADAGAMAGALTRAYEDFDDPPDAGGVADQIATQVAATNPVWGETSPNTAAVATFACPPEIGAAGRCVRVDVYRNGDNGSQSLPTLFGPVLGIVTQGVKATATAHVQVANATNCLKPWAIPDKWVEGTGDTTFRKYDFAGMPVAPPHDDYTAPSAADAGSGRTFATGNAALGDLGAFLTLTPMSLAEVTNPLTPLANGAIPDGALVALALDGVYEDNVAACNGQVVSVGSQMPISATNTPTNVDFETHVLADLGAKFTAATHTIDGSCAPACAPISPRLVAIALYDVGLFQLHHATNDWSSCPGSNPCVTIVNIVGFFIDNSTPQGYLTSYPGLIPTGAPTLTAASSFLKAVTLVR